MGRPNRERRKGLVVSKVLQRQIVAAVAMFPTLSLAFASVIVAVFCRKLSSEAAEVDAELPSLVALLIAVLGFVAVSAVIVVRQALRFSHRIAGPGYRFIKAMEQLRGGDIAFRIKLRRGDLLTEVADAINATLDWLNQHPPTGIIAKSDVVEAPGVELPEVCGGRPATRDALLAEAARAERELQPARVEEQV